MESISKVPIRKYARTRRYRYCSSMHGHAFQRLQTTVRQAVYVHRPTSIVVRRRNRVASPRLTVTVEVVDR